MKAVCIIPARGGSQRIPRKNVRPFCGKPMLAHAIDLAHSARLFDAVVVTTDDEEIADVAEAYGAEVFWRTKDDGTRGTQEVIAEVVRNRDEHLVCGLYPCVPLLTPEELTYGLRVLLSSQMRVCDYAYSYSHHKGADAGGFYWGFAGAFSRSVPLDGHATPVSVLSHFDINTPEEWADAEAMYRFIYNLPEEATA